MTPASWDTSDPVGSTRFRDDPLLGTMVRFQFDGGPPGSPASSAPSCSSKRGSWSHRSPGAMGRLAAGNGLGYQTLASSPVCSSPPPPSDHALLVGPVGLKHRANQDDKLEPFINHPSSRKPPDSMPTARPNPKRPGLRLVADSRAPSTGYA